LAYKTSVLKYLLQTSYKSPPTSHIQKGSKGTESCLTQICSSSRAKFTAAASYYQAAYTTCRRNCACSQPPSTGALQQQQQDNFSSNTT
jgi:hypothetical protein